MKKTKNQIKTESLSVLKLVSYLGKMTDEERKSYLLKMIREEEGKVL